MIRNYLSVLMIFHSFILNAQPIPSTVYHAKENGVMIKGESNVANPYSIETVKLKPGQQYAHKLIGSENLIINKQGVLGLQSKQLNVPAFTKNSIAIIMNGDQYTLKNTMQQDAAFYIISLTCKASLEHRDTCHSFVRLWEDVPFKTHEKGGVRNFFKQATSETQVLDMHVTTLNAGLKSHDPHTHKAEEIVVMIEGHTEMQIGDQFYQGKSGDVYFLGSMIPHAIRNTSFDKPSTYYAIQWD